MKTTRELLEAIDAEPDGRLFLVSPSGHEIVVHRGIGPVSDWLVFECDRFRDDAQADVVRSVLCLSGYELRNEES